MGRLFVVAFLSVSVLTLSSAKALDQVTAHETQIAGAAINDLLLDPSSAQFRITYVGHMGHAAVFCGYVNAKNAFGGYVGFHPFVVLGNDATLYQGKPGTAEAMKDMIDLTCHDHPELAKYRNGPQDEQQPATPSTAQQPAQNTQPRQAPVDTAVSQPEPRFQRFDTWGKSP